MSRKRGIGLKLDVPPAFQVLAEIEYLGNALLDKKATLPHGKFQKWVKSSKWPASPRTMRLYMQIARWLRTLEPEEAMRYRACSIRELAVVARTAAVTSGTRKGMDGLKRIAGAIPLPKGEE